MNAKLDTKTIEAEHSLLDMPTQALTAAPQHALAALADVPGDAMLAMIERAARDPSVDVDKMERLLALKERHEMQAARAAYFKAFAEMKPELPVIDRKGRIVIHEKGKDKVEANIIQETAFARWEDIDEAITPILTRHGFSLMFRSGVAPDGKITITGILAHVGGHSEETTITLPHDSSGSKNPVQAVGSSLTYGKRYAATFLLNIRTKGEDDDGMEGGATDITDEQAETIFGLIKSTKADTAKFCATFDIKAVADLPRAKYPLALEMLNTKARKLAGEVQK